MFNNDEDVKVYFEDYKKNHKIIVKRFFPKEFIFYVENRFKDYYKNENPSFLESLYRIVNDVFERPKCKTCGKPVKFSERFNRGFPNFCSIKCQFNNKDIKEKIKKTNKAKYGCLYPSQNPFIRKKIEKTNKERYGFSSPIKNKDVLKKRKENNIKKYGYEYPMQNEKVKQKQHQTNKEKYGVKSPLENKNIREKIEKTNIERYGSKSSLGNKIIREKAKKTNIERYGSEHSMQNKSISKKREKTCLSKYNSKTPLGNKEVQQKIYNSKKKNHSFNTSKPEEKVFEVLKNVYGEENVLSQYKSKVYPFNCDFYIKSLDLYIELNFHWTHGGHPFDPLNEEDVKLLSLWKNKNTKYFDHAVEIWSIKDPLKMKTAKDNNLNYKVFYAQEDFKDFLKDE